MTTSRGSPGPGLAIVTVQMKACPERGCEAHCFVSDRSAEGETGVLVTLKNSSNWFEPGAKRWPFPAGKFVAVATS